VNAILVLGMFGWLFSVLRQEAVPVTAPAV
jgi:hypothetical protein